MQGQLDTTPWYRQFWPWFLIALPATSFAVGFTMLSFAINTKDSLVVDDYYKEGKAINERLIKVEEAKKRNITTRLSIENNTVTLEFTTGQPVNGQALKLDFYHVTQIEKDFNVLLTRDAEGRYRASFDNNIQGKWRVRLTPLDEVWKIQKMINFPDSNQIIFNP